MSSGARLATSIGMTTAMTHLAVTEALDGKAVEWMEKVTDEQYLAGPSKEVADER